MHILFLTTNNLPTNPRLLKEVDLALSENKVTVILFKLGNWSDQLNKNEMAIRPQVNFIQLDATRSKSLSWLFWGLLEKLVRYIYPLFKNSLFINALTHSRRSLQLLNALKKVTDCNLIIGHNLGTLYPIYNYSLKKNTPFIYDIEDYDPGIHVPESGKHYQTCTEYLLKKCATEAQVLTSASPLIGEYTLKLIGDHPNHKVILNSFPQNEFKQPIDPSIRSESNAPQSFTEPVELDTEPVEVHNSQLKLVWFSQNISFGRGLEQLFEALNKLAQKNASNIIHQRSNIQLTLIGQIDTVFDQQIIQPFKSNIEHRAPNIKHHTSYIIHLNIIPPLSQTELHAELANHDVGLALEFNKTDLNRQLCLTNKIITYAQAGLYVLATNTMAQEQFIKTNPTLGKIAGQSIDEIKNNIVLILNHLDEINKKKEKRFESSKAMSWEAETLKLKALWKQILT